MDGVILYSQQQVTFCTFRSYVLPPKSCYQMTEWSVENNGKLYKYLCIGIGHPKEPFHSYRSGMSARVSETLMNRGTLLLFRLKMKPQRSSGFSLSRVWTQDKLPGGIFAIRPHPAG